MNYWDILDSLEREGRLQVCTALSGPSAGQKTRLAAGAVPEQPDQVFCESLQNPPRLFVFGAGHVGSALAQLAAHTVFEPTLIDPRPQYASPDACPPGVHCLCLPYEEAFIKLRFLPTDYLAIMTPGHAQDDACAQLACQVDVAYRGMMGSRAKVALAREKLKKAGLSQARIDSLHAPIGLAIGAQTPAEIAVSILAQMIQVYREKAPSILEGSIVSALKAMHQQSELQAVMCTIVKKTGSGPREVGTRMLAGPGGSLLAGTIGGGAVEAQVLKRAGQLLETEDNFALQTYHLSAQAAASIGMVCGGSCQVMFERLRPQAS